MPVNDIAAPDVGGQSQKYWTQGHVFADEICTNSVDTDASGFRLNLSRTGLWSTLEKDDMRANLSTVITYFMIDVEIVHVCFTLISSGCTYCSWEVHWFHWDIFCAILFFSVKHFFYLLHVYIFSIKVTIWSLTLLSLSSFSLVLLKMPVLLTGYREILWSSPHDDCSCDICYEIFFAFNHLWNTKTLWPLSFKCVRRRLCEEVKATLCVFAQQCVQLASESARGQAKGRTIHQRIHRTTECFLGGGWDSEREGSKKSLGNYLQLWAAFVPSRTHIYCGAGCNHKC